MSTPPLATLEDLEARLGQPVPADQETRALALLDDASALVRAVARRSWIEDGELADVPTAVVGVVANVAARAFRNPDGVTQDTAGPFTVSYGPLAAERLFLTRGEREILSRFTRNIGTISLTRGSIETDTVW